MPSPMRKIRGDLFVAPAGYDESQDRQLAVGQAWAGGPLGPLGQLGRGLRATILSPRWTPSMQSINSSGVASLLKVRPGSRTEGLIDVLVTLAGGQHDHTGYEELLADGRIASTPQCRGTQVKEGNVGPVQGVLSDGVSTGRGLGDDPHRRNAVQQQPQPLAGTGARRQQPGFGSIPLRGS